MHTTLAQIRAHKPCASGYRKLLQYLGTNFPDDKPINLAVIAESNGAADAIWCFRAVKGFNEQKMLVINNAVARAKQYAADAADAAADAVAAYAADAAANAAYAYAADAAAAAAAYAADAADAAADAVAANAAYAAAAAAYAAERKLQQQDIITIFGAMS